MQSHHSSCNWLVAVLFVIAFSARVALATMQGLNAPPESGTDQEEYDRYAWNLAQGRGYRGMSPDVADQDHLTAYRPPGPSLLFAAVYRVAGHNYAAVRLVNCLVAALAVFSVYRIGRTVFTEAIGMFAAAAYALFPIAVFQSTDLVSEPLGVLLFIVFLDFALTFAARPSWRMAALAGVSLGFALLARANFVLMIPLLGLWALWQFHGKWSVLMQAGFVFVIAGSTLLPWTIRNYYVFGKAIPFSTMGGSALLQGNNRLVVTDPKLFGYSVWDTQIPEYRDALRAPGDEVERDGVAKRFAVEWLLANKDKWAFLAWHKFIRSWTPLLVHNPSATHRLIYLASWGPILVLFCIGFIPTLIAMLRNGHPGWLLHLAVMHYVANSLIFFANIRYRAPIDPICMLIASWTLVQGWGLIRRNAIAAPQPPRSDVETYHRTDRPLLERAVS